VLLGEVKITGLNLSAEGVGSIAFGQPRVQAVINADYKFPRWPAFSADLSCVQAQNLTNAYYWNMALSPGFSQFPPRSLFGYLTADF
jgi:hypothetical protein